MKDERLTLRLDAELLARLDHHASRLNRRLPAGLDITRSAAARELLVTGLDRAEAREE